MEEMQSMSFWRWGLNKGYDGNRKETDGRGLEEVTM